ncbi:MAG: hypothetical protein BGO14_09845 [Chlamydiales bacterium 38-26]|nr:type III secretion system chaperone [Chlamydiales bacterium]OJV11271.1 MAG: hypothetical protein BGO14_09845 [Chlamydiales bacterium 38-26]
MIPLAQFCKQLSLDLGLEEPLKEETPGVFNLAVEEDMIIKISTVGEGVSFYAFLCECPKENVELFLTDIMDANLYGYITRNAVLGLSEDGNQLTLSHTIDYNIDYKTFNELLQDFYNVAIFWREQTLNNLNVNRQ